MLASRRDEQPLLQELATAFVEELNDGGMGSIRFAGSSGRKFGEQLAIAGSYDADGVPLSIAINADQSGLLFEVDIWKVNFTPLIRLPPAHSLTLDSYERVQATSAGLSEPQNLGGIPGTLFSLSEPRL